MSSPSDSWSCKVCSGQEGGRETGERPNGSLVEQELTFFWDLP